MDEEPYDPSKKKPRAITSGSEPEAEQEPGTDEEAGESEAEEADDPASDDEAAA
ncbi:hypothetical protein [Streptomyces sp. NPDC000134]|uniref:hypothetical protein n=1 Tax=Streptomyces sp. NPDC000134 TaxID=3364536 RepID=UPI0036B80E3C